MKMEHRTNFSVNTIRHYADKLWPNGNYGLVKEYDRKGKPCNWKSLYSLNDGKDWFSSKELTLKLKNICESRE